MNHLPFLADRILNTPLLITPEKLQVITSVLSDRIGVNSEQLDGFTGNRYVLDENGERSYTSYPITQEGIAIIRVVGTMVNRGAYVGASSGVVSYEGVKHQVKSAAGNSKVQAIIIDLQTPGGEAVGAFECAEQVRIANSKKPVVALVNGMAASAGYAIASGAGEIVTTPSGISGSIGVVMMHADYSKKLETEGIKPTLITAGAHKADGNPMEPLPDDVKSRLQTHINETYQRFLLTVEAGRGSRLDAEAARKTEAQVFSGDEAVKLGVADRIGTFESVLADLSDNKTYSGFTSNSRKGSIQMDTQNPSAETAETNAADLAGKARSEGANAAKTRIALIIGCDAAQGHHATLANSFAFNSDMSAEEAQKHLAVANSNTEAALSAQSKSTETAQDDGKGSEAGYLAEKEQAGALGLATPDAEVDKVKSIASAWDEA